MQTFNSGLIAQVRATIQQLTGSRPTTGTHTYTVSAKVRPVDDYGTVIDNVMDSLPQTAIQIIVT